MTTSQSEGSELRVIFAKRRSTGLVFGLSVPQLVLMGAAVALITIATQDVPGPVRMGLLVLATVVAAGAYVRHFGRPFADYIPSLVGEGVLRLARARTYRGGPARAAYARASDLPGSALPGSLSTISFESFDVGAGESVGVARDSQDGTVTGVLQVAGDTFSLLSTHERAARARALQRWLDGMAQPDSPIVAVQFLTVVLPDDGDEVHRTWRTRRVDSVNEFADQIYSEALNRDTRGGWTHESYIAIRIDPSANRAVRSQVKTNGGREYGAVTLLWEWMNQAATDLRDAGLSVLGWLPERGVAAVVRRAFDPDSSSMIARRGGGLGDQAGGDDGLPSGVAPEMCGPMRAEAAMSYYAHDGYLTRSWWVTEWPRAKEGVPVGFLQPLLLEANCWHTVSLTLTPLAGRKAQRAIDLQASTQDAKRQMDEKAKRRRRRRDQREEADVDRREVELVDGYSSWNVTGLVTCTASDEGKLLAAGSSITSTMNKASLEGQIWYVEQDQAMFCGALPLARIPS
ncbi:hypothetical protein CLV47_12344 [Antricoccus suffuscus]|uniref:PrgI family protein n=1 Tax=Antricoccus suffuscus TaxID=1629062 RepID=A0A2T0ZEM8_9ACTN|nr:SCO6880 family protein [Antricoccus suffuscus]PRZ34812.1 hypothetical protein CLV47_12344 [Antricoccus suffuscus]